MIQSYILILYPGFIVSDASEKEVSNRNYEEINIPEGGFGFRFFDREVLEGVTGKTYGEKHNFSPWYYKGKIRTINQIEKNSILYRNMENNNYTRIVETEYGQSIPLNDDDIVLLEESTQWKCKVIH